MTTQPADFAAVPPNVQVYETDPDALVGAALDGRSGRVLGLVTIGLVVALAAVALGRRHHRAGRRKPTIAP
jgi:hypothetical protein